MRDEHDREWLWMILKDCEWLGIITWWIIRWTSTFWWIEIKNLFSTDGYPMVIMTKFMNAVIFSWKWGQKFFHEIQENSRIFRNFVITVIEIFHCGEKLVANINYTGLDLTSTRWFLVDHNEKTGSKIQVTRLKILKKIFEDFKGKISMWK